MIIYKSTKREFINNAMASPREGKNIANLIKAEFEKRIGKVNDAEYKSWQNSLRHMAYVVDTDDIADEASVCIEFRLPFQSCRIDFLIAGKDEEEKENVVIVELKQWASATSLADKNLVRTVINGGERNVPHPSYQAWSYAVTLQEYNECVQKDGVLLHPCAFMHNYVPLRDDPIIDNLVYREIDKAPLFTCHDAESLRKYIASKVCLKDDGNLIYRIDYGRIKPSKSLQDVLGKMLDKNKEGNEFVLIDSQKSVFEFIMAEVHRMRNEDEKKKVFIVSGGPGTGKSVLAINLLASAIRDSKNAAYVTKNSAPRNVYQEKLAGEKFKRAYINSLFKSSGSFVACDTNSFDFLIVDEAHRLNEKSGLFAKGENQIKEIINAAKISVFFIDENQIVTAKDIGSIKEIKRFAKLAGAKVFSSQLESQFRCSGSDGYLSFLDDVLEIDRKPYVLSKEDYDVRIYDDLNKIFEDIREKNKEDNKARMLAGYCWNWVSKENHGSMPDIVIENQNFSAYWNFNDTKTWAIDEDSIDQIGCIHTSQGLEFSYVGVIIGNDLRYDGFHVITDSSKRAKTDASLHGLKEKGDDAEYKKDKIIRDTYRTLLSRGMKGCYIYCTDAALSAHFNAKLSDAYARYDKIRAVEYAKAAENNQIC